METNAQGQVAIKYRQSIPHSIVVNRKAYHFVVRAHICMSWIEAEHVDIVLQSVRRKCHCGGGNSKPHDYVLANSDDVRRWTVGGGR